jgi:voltage-gated potassium channel
VPAASWRRWPPLDRWFDRPRAFFQSRLSLTLLVPALLVAVGTAGYCLTEGLYWFESLYLTVITLTTIGYGDVYPHTVAGRTFTMVLVLGGVFTLFYAAAAAIRAIVGGEVQDILGKHAMERDLEQLNNHLIVCGYGRMGHLVCQQFAARHLPFVLIDAAAEMLAQFKVPHGIPLHGDATSDDVLRRAGIERARALITVMASDADNLFTTMSARLLNDKLFIVARVEDPHAEQKMLRAGADRVVSPYQIGGERMAQAVLRPTVVDFLDLATRMEHFELQIEEARVGPKSPLAGASLQDSRVRADLKIMIVAIKKEAEHMIFNPPPDARIEPGDILIAIGPRESLDQLDRLANG